MQGVAHGVDLSIKHALVLTAEFVPIGKKTGDKDNPVRDIYFKVLPKGTASVPGLLIGQPVLDHPPFGLGHQRKERSHYFSALSAHLPRGELPRRTAQLQQLKQWDSTGANFMGMALEQCCRLVESSRLIEQSPCAYLDAPTVQLEPNEQAIVPAAWAGLPPSCPSKFLCCTPPDLATEARVLPGLCSAEDGELMLCVENRSPDSIEIELGEVIAVGYEIPDGSMLHRKGYSVCPAQECDTEEDRDLLMPLTSDEDMFLWMGEDSATTVSAGGAEPSQYTSDEVYHLVQDDNVISHIHNEELPPDCYYDELKEVLRRKFPKASPGLIDHAVALVCRL